MEILSALSPLRQTSNFTLSSPVPDIPEFQRFMACASFHRASPRRENRTVLWPSRLLKGSFLPRNQSRGTAKSRAASALLIKSSSASAGFVSTGTEAKFACPISWAVAAKTNWGNFVMSSGFSSAEVNQRVTSSMFILKTPFFRLKNSSQQKRKGVR
jgi:hypothetical protein